MKAIANYLSFDGDLNHLSYDNEVSMFWLRGRGFWKKGMPDDICRVYQTHINPILQVCKLLLLIPVYMFLILFYLKDFTNKLFLK